MRQRLTASLLGAVASLCLPAAGWATLINGDFDSGDFHGWTGQVSYTDPTDGVITEVFSPPPGAYGANFDASSGAAVLTTSPPPDDVPMPPPQIWSVVLFQDFDMPTVGGGESLVLSWDLMLWTTSSDDLVLAQLAFGWDGSAYTGTTSLLGISSLDVTGLQGQTVQLLFGVEDLDEGVDSLRVDDIAFETGTPVPEPGTMGLVLLGLGLGASAKRRRGSDRGV